MKKEYSKNTQYAKLEFFQNFGDEVKYYQSEIKKEDYDTLDNDVYKIINNVEKNLKKIVFYKGYNLYFLIRIEMYELLIQDLLFLKFYHESIKQYDQIIIYTSENFLIDDKFIFSNEILKLPRIKFIKKKIKTKYDLKKFDYERIESPIKILIKKLFSFKNFAIRFKKDNLFIQNQPKILNLLRILNRDFFSDYLYRDFKNIINLKKGYLYFYGKRNFPLKNNYVNIGINFEKDLEEIFIGFFKFNRKRIIDLLEQIINKFNKNNIKCSIIQTYDYLVERVIIQYHFQNKSKCFLYHHGLINTDNNRFDVDKFLYGYLAWGEYDYNLILNKFNNLKVIKFGNSFFNDKKFEKHMFFPNKDNKFLILQNVTSYTLKDSYENNLKININIFNLLISIGVKRENIFLKLHPGRSNFHELKKYFSNIYLRENIFNDENIEIIINKSDIIIGPTSTVMYETVMKNKIYICYSEFENKINSSIFFNSDFLVSRNIEELKNILLKIKNVNFRYSNIYNKLIYDTDMDKKIKLINEIVKI